MSLFTTNPHRVQVRPATLVEGDLASRVVLGDPIPVARVAVQPISSTETDTNSTDEYKVIGRGIWPGGTHARVIVVTGPHKGEYDQQGEAVVHGMTPRTEHYVVRLRRRGQEV